MSNSVFMALKVSKELQNDRIVIDNVDFEKSVADFRDQVFACNQIQEKLSSFNKDVLNFVYTGLILDKKKTLSSYGLKAGATIFVLLQKVPKPIEQEEFCFIKSLNIVKQLDCIRFRKKFIEILSQPKVIDSIINDHIEITKDPVALAILRDPELLMNVFLSTNFLAMNEKHPSFGPAAIAAIEKASAAVNEASPSASSSFSFSLQAMSDEDLSDLDDSFPEEGHNESNHDDDDEDNVNMEDVITPNMLEGALRSAMGNQRSASTESGALPDSGGSQSNAEPFAYESQLQQLHELGFMDDTANRAALNVTSGNLQEAINIILLWN